MAGHGVFRGEGRRRAVLVTGFAVALVAAAVVALAVAGISEARSGDQRRVNIHKVDRSPQDVRDFWNSDRMEKAKTGDPMPNVTSR